MVIGDINAAENETGFSNIERVEFGVKAVVLGLAANKCISVGVVGVNIESDLLEAVLGGRDFVVEVGEQCVHITLLISNALVCRAIVGGAHGVLLSQPIKVTG